MRCSVECCSTAEDISVKLLFPKSNSSNFDHAVPSSVSINLNLLPPKRKCMSFVSSRISRGSPARARFRAPNVTRFVKRPRDGGSSVILDEETLKLVSFVRLDGNLECVRICARMFKVKTKRGLIHELEFFAGFTRKLTFQHKEVAVTRMGFSRQPSLSAVPC